jgi:molybdenum cofactor guanylyltransferase
VLTRALALELRERNITVNAVSVEVHRPCAPNQVADVIGYLLSEHGQSLTGQVLRVGDPGLPFAGSRIGLAAGFMASGDAYHEEMAGSAGVVLAGGRSSRMGTAKAALEWHGSTLLRRTVGIVARAAEGPVVVVRADGQDLPDLPKGTVVVDDPREGKGPVQGIAAGLAALGGRADTAFVCSTDMPFLHPAFVRRVLRVLSEREGTDVALPVARGYRQPLAAAYRVSLAEAAERLVKEDRLRPAFLFEQCVVASLDDDTLRQDPVLAALDPDLDSVLNVNTPADYQQARARPEPEVTIQLFGILARGDSARGPRAVRAATVDAAARAAGLTFDRHVSAALNGDQITRDGTAPLATGDVVFFMSADAGG